MRSRNFSSKRLVGHRPVQLHLHLHLLLCLNLWSWCLGRNWRDVPTQSEGQGIVDDNSCQLVLQLVVGIHHPILDRCSVCQSRDEHLLDLGRILLDFSRFCVVDDL